MKADRTWRFLWFVLLAGASLGPLPLPGWPGDPHPLTPEDHGRNQQLAATAHEANLKRYAGDPGVLVLPGLVADRDRRRVEVMVERTRLGPDSPCEFLVIAETSDHGYEALLTAFARPGDVQRGIEFIGTEPGGPVDPGANRFWARGEPFTLTVVGAPTQRFRVEELLVDRRTGQTLRAEGFLFTGSPRVPAPGDPQAWVYAADEYQPKAIVSLFNSAHAVLQVPYPALKAEVYQNTVVNPEHPLPEGAWLSLVIEPARPAGSRRTKDLLLWIEAGNLPPGQPLAEVARLGALRMELQDGGTTLNTRPTLLAVMEALVRLDRGQHDYRLTVTFAGEVRLREAQGVARILSTIDSEKGARIEPPPAGQLYYRAFTPDPGLLECQDRLYHPWELRLVERGGRVEGTLRYVDSIWRPGSPGPELTATEVPVTGPEDLRVALAAEGEQARKAGTRPRPPVMLVFAPAELRYADLLGFLAPVWPANRAVHVYLDTPLPPVPAAQPKSPASS